ncbi:MAG: IS1 family transposase [Nitrospirae bacterium]|nr:IS1 family transposase [Nitrospirota bacterium]
MTCIQCGSEKVVKNGSIHNGKQKFMCKECGRQFVENPQNIIISQETKNLIDKLLLERMALAAIVRVTGVSERWLQDYVNQKYDTVPQYVDVKKIEKGRLTIQCDEMWSFVGNKENKQWIWLALDDYSREVVGAFVGSRDMEGSKGLWDSLPPVYRKCAICYTDFWTAYAGIIPSKRHRPVGKESGKTSHIERFNCTMRQRISRLVRKSLSFSKKIENHIGAVWYFIHHYNASLVSA